MREREPSLAEIKVERGKKFLHMFSVIFSDFFPNRK